MHVATQKGIPMNQQAPNSPPPIPMTNPSTPKRKRTWWKLTLLIIAGAIFIIKVGSYGSLDLELTRKGLLFDEDGQAVEIVNTGSKTTVISAIQINDRTDCSIATGMMQGDDFKPPFSLKIGDKLTLLSSCRIIRVSVETDTGSGTYSFASQ
jgi:hypothetical protein